MKISKATTDILRNFASINSSIYIRQGKQLRTTTVGNDIFAVADIEDEFPRPFAIFDLNRLLGAMSLFNDPEIELGDKFLTIKAGTSKIKYVYASENLVVKAPEGEARTTSIASFVMPDKLFAELQKASAILSLPDLTIIADAGKLSLKVHHKKDPSSDSHVVEVGECLPEIKFVVDVNIDKLKLLAASYRVDVGTTAKGRIVINFKTEGYAVPVAYWITAEATSKVS